MPLKFLTVGEVAGRLRRHPETVREMLREGRLHGFRTASRSPWLISEDSLASVLKSSKPRSRRRRSPDPDAELAFLQLGLTPPPRSKP